MKFDSCPMATHRGCPQLVAPAPGLPRAESPRAHRTAAAAAHPVLLPPPIPTTAAVAEAVRLLPAPLAPACPELLVDYLLEVFEEGDGRALATAR
jgi:hypothetical protein